MKNLVVTIENFRFPRPAQFFLSTNAVKNLYYFLLFATDPRYYTKTATWISWLRMGFDHTIREQPRAATRGDRLNMTVRSNLRCIEISASSENGAILATEAGLLCHLGRIGSTQFRDRNECVEILSRDPKINRELISKIPSALHAGEITASTDHLRNGDIATISKIVTSILMALTHKNIKSIDASCPPIIQAASVFDEAPCSSK